MLKNNKYNYRIDRLDNRMEKLSNLNKNNDNLIKVAFDSSKINQFTDYNPRRNLQHYSRSEDYISEKNIKRLEVFNKLKTAMDELEIDLRIEPEWLDSYTRVLRDSTHKVLRTAQSGNDFFDRELDYLEELIDMRYRLSLNEIKTSSLEDIKIKILSKDTSLLKKYSFYKKENVLYRTSGEEINTKLYTSGNEEKLNNNNNKIIKDKSEQQSIISPNLQGLPISINVVNNMAQPQQTNSNDELREMSIRLAKLEELLKK